MLEILRKLPAKSVMRCMYVCKSWHSLIKTRTFISTHLKYFSFQFDDEELNENMHLDYPLVGNRYFDFINSGNGVVCFADCFYPHSKTLFCGTPPSGKFNNNEMPMIEVYSLIAGSWKFLPSTRQKYNIVQKCKQAFVNGVVHFIAFQEDEHGDTEKMYVPGFDFSDEESTIAIFCIESYSPIQCSLWAMKKYGDLESWTKLFAKQGEAVPWALGLRKSGELLLDFYRSSTKGIVSYDAEKQQSKSINIHNKRGDHFLCTYVESLALLDKP
ncbi:hypothetical protein P3X46_024220 [Hevea brasiliensis]|uniref:F-box domain-containing protein n=1 Tax=Hevea brasiliensis TaxID=3981 RepID=A0ABQ9L5D2_HEVBR|nr:hypothetical protein P3X46_024220 [Hevea brasiliensis]